MSANAGEASESIEERIKRKLTERKERALSELEVAELKHQEAELKRMAAEEERKAQLLRAGGEIPVETEKQEPDKAAEVAAQAVAAGVDPADAKDLATRKKPVVVINPTAAKDPLHSAVEQAMADMLREKLKGDNKPSGGFLDELDRVTGGALSKRIADLLFPVPDRKAKTPEEELLERIEFSKKVREALGVKEEPAIRSALAEGGELKTELIRLLLEDERERLKIQKEYEARMEQAKAKAEENAFLMPLITEGIGALRETASSYNRRARAQGVGATEQKPKRTVTCTNPQCGKPFTAQADFRGKIACPHCMTVLEV